MRQLRRELFVCDSNDTKQCRRCKKTLPIGRFPRRKNDNGIEYRENYCNPCNVEKNKWAGRREWLREETLNGACMSIYLLCAFGEDDENTNDKDGTTAYLKLLREMNKGAVSLEE